MTDLNYNSGVGGQTDGAAGKTANLIYILYLASLIFGITAIIGVVMAYLNRDDAPEWVKSHYTFQIRTFWIGLLFGLIGAFTLVFLVGWLIMLFVAVWWIVHCVKGMKFISANKPCPDPTSWMFG